jgi:hypothetical protein
LALNYARGFHEQIVGARELVDLSPLDAAAESSAEFEIQTCRAVSAIDDLGCLHELLLLGINDCGRIDTIRPIAELQKLRCFLAWESTRVVDNDLSPLLALPELVEIRMRDRRDYKPKVREIRELLEARA